MVDYDYEAGKIRIEAILDNPMDTIEQDSVPSDSSFTFNNSYYGWITAIFIDIRNSTELFSNDDKEEVSRVIRSFTSETIEILRKDENLREIGIRGDCVYSIYSTPQQRDIYNVVQMAYYQNTYMKMLCELLSKRFLPEVNVGIGISTAKELVIKAGRKDTGINSKVWIGEAVTKASKLSSLGNREGISPIVLSNTSYINIIDQQVKISGEEAKGWFNEHNDKILGQYYDANIIKSVFNAWIIDGMAME